MKKIVATGINGLVGTHLVNDLLEKGYIVKGLIRNKSKFQGKLHPHLELVQGNLFDDLTPLMNEADAVIHMAAETNPKLITYSDYWKVNYKATVQLINTAIRSKVKKFIFISTSNTLGYGSTQELGNENKEIQPPFDKSFYVRSKLEAENYLLQKKDKIDAIIINPSFILGSYCSEQGSGKIVLMGWKKKIIFYPPGGKNFVHVKDVSKAIIASLEKGKNGEKYFIGNENLSYSDFFKKLNKSTHQKPFMIKVPKFILKMIGYVGDMLRFFKIKTSLSSVHMNMLCIDNFYCNKKAITELKLNYQPIENAIIDTIIYFKNGSIKINHS